MDLRVEGPGERAAVRDVHEQAFGDDGARVADLADALRTDRSLSLVAVAGGRIVGNVMFSDSLLDAPRRLVDVQVLSPVGVLPDHQGRGVAAALIRRGLEMLSSRDVPVVFLEGSPGYYRRFGFAAGAEQGFRKPSLRIPDAAFQAVKLPAYEPWMTGTLVYSAPFWQLDFVGLRDGDA
jgi:putative acetyltransferase